MKQLKPARRENPDSGQHVGFAAHFSGNGGNANTSGRQSRWARSLLGTLTTGEEPRDDRALCWLFRLGPNKALHSWGIRQGAWKLWRGPLRTQDEKQLFDMANSPKSGLFNIPNDIHEDRDLSGEQPAKRRELETELGRWMQTLPSPRWGDSMGAKSPLP